MPTPSVEGGTPQQHRLLQEIVGRIDTTDIDRLMIRPFERAPEGEPPAEGPVGTEVFAVLATENPRALWDVELIGETFVRESRLRHLPDVVWLSTRNGGRNVEWTPAPIAPLGVTDLTIMRAQTDQAVRSGSLERFETLQPLGTAIAITVSVVEPHSFLRHTSRELLTAISEWRDRCDGIYTEIRDRDTVPVLTAGWRRSGGQSSTRHDVECCAPQLTMSRPIMWESPPCPVFD